MERRVVLGGVVKEGAAKSVRAYSPWPTFFVFVLAFRPFLWTSVRKSFLKPQVSCASAESWEFLPGRRNLCKPNGDLAFNENFAV